MCKENAIICPNICSTCKMFAPLQRERNEIIRLLTKKFKVMSEIQERVKAIIVDKLGVEESEVAMEVRNNKSFNEIQVMRDGVMAQLGNKAYYVYHDEGDVYFQKVEEENRYSYSNSNEEQKITIDAQLLLMLFMNQQVNNSQIRRMNQLYESQNIYSRDRETIEKEIAKFEKRKFEAEQRMGDGIAESMGYGQIVSRYNEMIEDRKRELRNIGN